MATPAGFTILSPSGAPQCNNSYINRVSPITTSTNNGQYYILQYQNYATSQKQIYRALYRVTSGTTVAVDNSNIYTTNHMIQIQIPIFTIFLALIHF